MMRRPILEVSDSASDFWRDNLQTIVDLVSEIRWNPNMRSEEAYSLVYYDRVSNARKSFFFDQIVFEKSDKFGMSVRKGVDLSFIPYHRIREVRCGEETIWKRDVPRPGKKKVKKYAGWNRRERKDDD
jgi:uncharacterized protein (UPF0248 family)